jgi:eukaryotic-like serine/threonine-protein kinase
VSIIGTRIGPYEIVALLGAGGMGDVYRARDTRLGREAAIKILPPAFAADPDRLARFEREARVLASLSHPNIAHIYGVEEGNGIVALVLELVAGDTLAVRLRGSAGRGLGVASALLIARQIADALDAAHERGIVHRDLKPANIVVTADGAVKVLDFGLAKTGEAEAGANQGLTDSPTFMATAGGVLLGTAPYMSPEQTRGRVVDKRTDIWALGCVLYEMLAGRRAFSGDTTSDVIAAILERDPDWSALPASTPLHVRRLLQRCLEKDPKRRLRDVGDVSSELNAAPEPTDASRPRSLPGRRVMARWAGAAALALGVIGWTIVAMSWREATPDWARNAATFSIVAPVTRGASAANPAPGIAVSRDGRFIAWTAENAAGRPAVWLYSADKGETTVLSGTDGATNPFWSPDGRAIGFLTQAKLETVDLSSGSVRALVSVPESSIGGTWNTRDVIVYSARYALYQVSVTGGTPKVVAELDHSNQENSLRYPRFLPDGQHFLYVARSGLPDHSSVYVGSLDGPPRRLFATTSYVYYAPPGFLLYAKDGALVARTFDTRSFAVGGEPATVVDRIGANANGMNGHFDVSDNGVLAYFQSSTVANTQFRWFDRSGRPLDTLNEPAPYANFRVAPDDARVAVDLASERVIGRDVWVLTAGAAPTRITFGGSDEWWPFWSPDGQRVAFMSYRNGVSDFYVKAVNGSAPEEPLIMSDAQKAAGDWAPDGQSVAYWVDTATMRGDIWVSPIDRTQQPIPIAHHGERATAPFLARWAFHRLRFG